MTTIEKITQFRSDIYFLNQQELQREYIEIIETFVAEIDLNHATNRELQKRKLEVLEALFEALKENDFVLMADALYSKIPPFFGM